MITRLPYECLADDLQDPNYGAPSLQTQTKTQAHLLKSFQTRWKHKYLTSLWSIRSELSTDQNWRCFNAR